MKTLRLESQYIPYLINLLDAQLETLAEIKKASGYSTDEVKGIEEETDKIKTILRELERVAVQAG